MLAALALNAVAHGRWLLAAPVGVALLVAVLARWKVPHRPGVMLLVGLAGVGLGVALHLFAPTPPGPIPPVVLSPLCGGLVGVSAFCALSGNRNFAWVYAWLLAVLSANVAASPTVLACLGALAVCSLLAVLLTSQLPASGTAGVAGFLLLIALVGAATVQLSRLIRASEGWLMDTVAQFTGGSGVRATFQLRRVRVRCRARR